MFNNAGIAQAVRLIDTTEEQWSRLMRVNGLGVLLGIQEAARQFIKQGTGGKIINTASVGGKQGFAFVGAYCASKFAVVGLTQAAARELATHRITVNGFCPGIVATELWRNLDEQIMHVGLTSKIGDAMAQFGRGHPVGPRIDAGGLRRHRRLSGLRRLRLHDGPVHPGRRGNGSPVGPAGCAAGARRRAPARCETQCNGSQP
jgi:NAD(P)-dependent dehydrogenase (short-subunit alcohol dehydrogenase family)